MMSDILFEVRRCTRLDGAHRKNVCWSFHPPNVIPEGCSVYYEQHLADGSKTTSKEPKGITEGAHSDPAYWGGWLHAKIQEEKREKLVQICRKKSDPFKYGW
jgi:hypothetical protein